MSLAEERAVLRHWRSEADAARAALEVLVTVSAGGSYEVRDALDAAIADLGALLSSAENAVRDCERRVAREEEAA